MDIKTFLSENHRMTTCSTGGEMTKEDFESAMLAMKPFMNRSLRMVKVFANEKGLEYLTALEPSDIHKKTSFNGWPVELTEHSLGIVILEDDKIVFSQKF